MTDVLVKPPARCPTMAPSTRTLKSLFRLELQCGCGTAAVESPISSNLYHEPTSNLPHLCLPRLPCLPSDQIYDIPIASSRPAAIQVSMQSMLSTQSTLSTHSTQSMSVRSGYEPPSCQRSATTAKPATSAVLQLTHRTATPIHRIIPST